MSSSTIRTMLGSREAVRTGCAATAPNETTSQAIPRPIGLVNLRNSMAGVPPRAGLVDERARTKGRRSGTSGGRDGACVGHVEAGHGSNVPGIHRHDRLGL